MATNETFADRLTKLRENTGKKRQEVADELKISRASLEYYEKGKRKPDIEVLVKIAEYYEVSTDYLLGLSIAPTTNKDIQFICDYTGLSEEVIEELNEIKLCATQGYICKTPINKNLIENNPDFVETAKKEEVDNTKLSQTLENSNTTNNDMISLGNLESAEKSQKASIITDEEDSYDLQKELEAKFDELFGPIDEE